MLELFLNPSSDPHTLIWWWCSAPARPCACLWNVSLRHGPKQWSQLWTPASQSEWTSHDPRGQSQTCSGCWTSCPWWPGSDPQWSSPGVGFKFRGGLHSSTYNQQRFIYFNIRVSLLKLTSSRSLSKRSYKKKDMQELESICLTSRKECGHDTKT